MNQAKTKDVYVIIDGIRIGPAEVVNVAHDMGSKYRLVVDITSSQIESGVREDIKPSGDAVADLHEALTKIGD